LAGQDIEFGTGTARAGLRFRSPWLEQLDPEGASTPLVQDIDTDVAIVGAGIAGLATAFFVLRDTRSTVALIERSRVGRGASGRNGGQLVTYFERPLCDLVDAFGFDLATRGQAEIESAWGLLDELVSQSAMQVNVERFVGAMGMFSLNHLLVHLRNNRIRKQAGLEQESIEISADAGFNGAIPGEYADLYKVVAQDRIRQLLEVDGDDYVAVLLNRKGCANSALICQELLRYLRQRYSDRLIYADETTVESIVLEQNGAVLAAGSHTVRAARVILCTNGFSHHAVENRAGHPIAQRLESKVHARIGYMAGFTAAPGMAASATSYINNVEIGGKKPYYYVTRRRHVLNGQETSLICLGGPESNIEDAAAYDAEADLPVEILRDLDTMVRPVVAPARPAGLAYDYTWHGLMAYTDNKVRIVGFEPRNRVLMYNLGCNGVGFLPSIAGGFRIAMLHSGKELEPSIFDPM
jgi:glycine/D-amino acid oxidase-like deaminating enzyme